ncbi:putative long-chain-alcohol O-fatty-acyltransferase [Arachis hypogaea]|nr:putative long-chain-alcohol O-fatty-acyltransferase [Arachis hypogaea]
MDNSGSNSMLLPCDRKLHPKGRVFKIRRHIPRHSDPPPPPSPTHLRPPRWPHSLHPLLAHHLQAPPLLLRKGSPPPPPPPPPVRPLSLLPIKLQNYPPEIQRPSLNYAFPTAIVALATLIPLYTAKQSLHPKFVLFLYSLHMYIGLEFIFFVFSFFTRKLLGVQLEPQFDQPYLSTSLQDFWGRRWNIVVHKVLQPTVYQPVATASTRLLGRRWAPIPAILATFVVSAAMHELVFYYIKRERRGAWEPWEPSWDAICFFMLHGTCLAIEVAVKKWLRARGSKWRLPGVVSWILTVAFVYETALRLFFPALARCRVYEKATRELNAVMEFGKEVYGVLRFACFHVTRNVE